MGTYLEELRQESLVSTRFQSENLRLRRNVREHTYYLGALLFAYDWIGFWMGILLL